MSEIEILGEDLEAEDSVVIDLPDKEPVNCHCGSPNIMFQEAGGKYRLQCKMCGLFSTPQARKEWAIDAWNRRMKYI